MEEEEVEEEEEVVVVVVCFYKNRLVGGEMVFMKNWIGWGDYGKSKAFIFKVSIVCNNMPGFVSFNAHFKNNT